MRASFALLILIGLAALPVSFGCGGDERNYCCQLRHEGMHSTSRLRSIVHDTTVEMMCAIQTISGGVAHGHGRGEVAEAEASRRDAHRHRATNGDGVAPLRGDGVEKVVQHSGSSTDGQEIHGKGMDGISNQTRNLRTNLTQRFHLSG